MAKAALRQPVFWIVVFLNELKARNFYVFKRESKFFT